MARTNDFKRAELLKQRVEEYDAAGLSSHRNAQLSLASRCSTVGICQKNKAHFWLVS